MTQLMHGEREILRARQHWSVMMPTALLVAAVLVVGLIAIQLLPNTILSHDISGLKGILTLIDIIVVVVIFSLRYVQWRFATYILTDHRIVVNRGVVSRVTESIALARIQETIVRQNVSERIFGCGSMEVTSAGRDGVEVIYRIPRPQEFYNAVMEAMEADRFATPQQAGAPVAPRVPPPPPPPSAAPPQQSPPPV